MEAYRNRTASPEQLLAINDHIFECDQCFRLVDSPEKVRAAYEAVNKYVLLGVEHLDYDQVELDAAYDQKRYEPLLERAYRRLVSSSELIRERLGPELSAVTDIDVDIASEAVLAAYDIGDRPPHDHGIVLDVIS